MSTTMVYTHVMNRPGIAVRSPADALAQKRKPRDATVGKENDTDNGKEPAATEDNNKPRK